MVHVSNCMQIKSHTGTMIKFRINRFHAYASTSSSSVVLIMKRMIAILKTMLPSSASTITEGNAHRSHNVQVW